MKEVIMYRSKNFLLFLAASTFLGVGQSIDAATLNNFLNDTFQLSISQRTLLEFPRELSGFLVVFITGLLFTLGDIRIAALANIFAAIGMFGLGYFAKDFTTMLICLTIFSLGQHLFLPLQNSIGMSLTDGENFGVGVSAFAFLGFIIVSTGIFFKPAVDKDDVSPTLSMGISLDHAVSMVLPFLGGLIWNSLGYQYVFVFGAAVASLNLFLSSKITLDIDVAS